jgi:hypothetical protein
LFNNSTVQEKINQGIAKRSDAEGGAERSEAAERSDPLGNITEIAFTCTDNPKAYKLNLFLIQTIAQELLQNERVAKCFRFILPNKNSVDILHSSSLHDARFQNLMVCDSIWGCPVCANKISRARRQEVESVLPGLPGLVILESFTLQHDKTDNASGLLASLVDAYRNMKTKRSYTELSNRYGILGSIKSLECTYSQANGFHPHLHVLEALEGKLSGFEYQEYCARLSYIFRCEVDKLKRYSHPDHGVDFRRSYDNLGSADYVAKWGLSDELTRGVSKFGMFKGNYTPFELLREYGCTGNRWASSAFVQYYFAFKGHHQLTWSRGFRDYCGLDAEKTDEVLNSTWSEDYKLLCSISRFAWGIVKVKRQRAELLNIAAGGNLSDISEYFKRLGVPEWEYLQNEATGA